MTESNRTSLIWATCVAIVLPFLLLTVRGCHQAESSYQAERLKAFPPCQCVKVWEKR